MLWKKTLPLRNERTDKEAHGQADEHGRGDEQVGLMMNGKISAQMCVINQQISEQMCVINKQISEQMCEVGLKISMPHSHHLSSISARGEEEEERKMREKGRRGTRV